MQSMRFGAMDRSSAMFGPPMIQSSIPPHLLYSKEMGLPPSRNSNLDQLGGMGRHAALAAVIVTLRLIFIKRIRVSSDSHAKKWTVTVASNSKSSPLLLCVVCFGADVSVVLSRGQVL